MVNLKTLVDFASSVLGIVRNIRADEKDRLQRVAKLLGQIADCMQRIIDAARKGEWGPLNGNCEELGAYFQRFGELDLGPFLSDQDKQLLRQLEEAIIARRGSLLAFEFGGYGKNPTIEQKASIEQNVVQMEKAAGSFRAAQNLLLATA